MRRLQRSEGGQILIQTAIFIVVLLLCVALAIDVGNILWQRRNMQNAADAAALAGAQEICFGTNPTVASVRAVAQQYAITRNGATSAVITPTLGTGEVEVVATVNTDTYLLGLIGMNMIPVPARAMAQCGRVCSASNLWPVAFRKAWYDNYACNEDFYVWSDDKVDTVNCALYDCNIFKSGFPNDLVTGGDRGWLDFSAALDPSSVLSNPCDQAGCGASELDCYVAGDADAMVTFPRCIAGTGGVKASVWQEAGKRAGDVVRIPLYTSVGCVAPGQCTAGVNYYVDNASCVRVVKIETLTVHALPGSGEKDFKGKVIHVRKECGCAAAIGRACGPISSPSDLRAVSLMR